MWRGNSWSVTEAAAGVVEGRQGVLRVSVTGVEVRAGRRGGHVLPCLA